MRSYHGCIDFHVLQRHIVRAIPGANFWKSQWESIVACLLYFHFAMILFLPQNIANDVVVGVGGGGEWQVVLVLCGCWSLNRFVAA